MRQKETGGAGEKGKGIDKVKGKLDKAKEKEMEQREKRN